MASPMDLTSGRPLWPAKDGRFHTYPSLQADVRCDVVVIGGGVTGAMIAHHLVEAGIDTVVVDKRSIGCGSTAASTAILQYELDTTLTELSTLIGEKRATRAYLACRDALLKIGRLADKLRGDFGFQRRQSLYLAAEPSHGEELRAEFDRRRAIGLTLEYLDQLELRSRFGLDRPAALLTEDAGHLDAFALTHLLLRGDTGEYLRVFDNTTIESTQASPTGVRLRASGHEITARYVVYAMGYETATLLKPEGTHLASTYAVASAPIPSIEPWDSQTCVIWEHARPYLYLRRTEDGRVIIGGEDEPFKDPELREEVMPAKVERLTERFAELFPHTPITAAYAWAGTFAETRDGLAYIGKHPDWPSAFFPMCYGGNGITYSVIAAEIIRDSVLGRVHPDEDLFRFDR
jgi:glycine/D-amino acid oxidase-like deaminating enzyme